MAPSVNLQSGILKARLPENTRQRLLKDGIDPETYPARPEKPQFLDEVYKIRGEHWYSNLESSEECFDLTDILLRQGT